MLSDFLPEQGLNLQGPHAVKYETWYHQRNDGTHVLM